MTDAGGHGAPVRLSDAEVRAYGSLHTAAALVDRSDRMRMTFTGDRAKAALGGLLTNDVVALTAGGGQRAAALTPKGRVIALVRVFDRGDDLLVDADGAAGPGFVAMIRKFVNPRLARYADVTAATGCLGVYGPQSAGLLAQALGAPGGDHAAHGPVASSLAALAEHGILAHGEDDARVDIVRSGDLGVVGFDCVATPERIAALGAALTAAGVPRATPAVTAVARVEAGIPQWGAEMDDETIPQEADLDLLGAVSFSKGCYTGQEVVARIHFRGHVNRHLRRLRADAGLPVGATIEDAGGKEVGTVRSSVVSPRQGALAIGMVRREVAPGSEVVVRAGDARVRAVCERLQG
jgi:tRNA-modifying protein YgfZ